MEGSVPQMVLAKPKTLSTLKKKGSWGNHTHFSYKTTALRGRKEVQHMTNVSVWTTHQVSRLEKKKVICCNHLNAAKPSHAELKEGNSLFVGETS